MYNKTKDRLTKEEETVAAAPPPSSKEELLLTEIRDLLKK
jgi:large conductance mechanosensitive channel